MFKLLNEYSRTRYECVVAEMFLTGDKTQYHVCFRPVAADRDSADRYACRYLQIAAEEAERMTALGALTGSLREELDRELSVLRRPYEPSTPPIS